MLRNVLLIILILAMLGVAACGQSNQTKVDSSSLESSAKTLSVVLKDVGQEWVAGKVSFSQLQKVVPELFRTGIELNLYLLDAITAAAGGEEMSDEISNKVRVMAKRLQGMSAKDIINKAKSL